MARARLLKPGFFKNEFLAQVSPHARLLFAGLWVLADRRGRMENRPLKIKGELFPFESVDVESLLQELVLSPGRFITCYEVAGNRFIQIENFHKHQNPHKNEVESEIPPFIPERSSNGSNDSGNGASDSSNYASGSEKIGTTPEKDQTTRALNLNPLTLNLHTEISDSRPDGLVCVSPLEKVSLENQKLAEEGMAYLIALNHPNFTNPQWVKGWLAIQLQELEQTRLDIPKPEILRLWRDTCDLATNKNKPAPQWSKSTFKNKLDAWTPEQVKTPLPDQASGEQSNKAKALLEFPFVRHIVTGEIYSSESLEVKPDAPNGLTNIEKLSYYPVAHLEGLTELPA